ncbi:MAG: gluconate 2-dehydrogenase subunit 3 family protein [Candidatus Synoicihabitans palmerolidicus]|nr:gluconate 2-dehydrogenase subunit 3 family protein [Candidatus Synoicihabitans palmerolidicus]
MAEALLPRTDTPGVIDIGVPPFIDELYGLYLPSVEKIQLESFLDHTITSAFTDAPFAEQQQRLRDFGAPNSPQNPAVRQFRRAVLLGYFTSEKISKDVLVYDPIPAPPRSRHPPHRNQRSSLVPLTLYSLSSVPSCKFTFSTTPIRLIPSITITSFSSVPSVKATR